MSAIIFHSEDRISHVRGTERAWAGHLCNGLMMSAIDVGIWHHETHWIRNILPDGHYLLTMPYDHYGFKRALESYLMVDGKFKIRDDAFCVSLNTALVSGSDPLKLLARLHGQCEIHCFVEGKNRQWLSEIILAGRGCGMYREGAGWEDVIDHLQLDDKSPVVCSYSVCDSFPSPYIADPSMNEDEAESWYDKPPSEQWESCMSVIRSERLELKPDDWNDWFFGTGINGFTLKDHATINETVNED